MSTSNDNVDRSSLLERLDDFRCHLDGIVLDSSTPENTTGGFGDLFIGTHPIEGKLALKRPRGDLYNPKAVAAIEIEASVWKMLRHPSILQFFGIHTIDDSVYFVSPYAENGSLPEFIQRRPDVDRKRLVIEIAEGVLYLHQCAIVHGDLKGKNVLISKFEHVQICDFGLAKHVTSRTATSMRGAGTLPWQSPEVLQNAEKKTFESDVYAFGITIYEVLSGKEPYSHHLGLFSLITGVVLGGERPPKDPSTGSDGSSYLQFWDEAEKCWDGEPTRRPSMLDVLRRLDPQRFEVLVTSQQVSLEKSLNVGAQEQTHFQVAMALPPFSFENELLEPVQLARRIQARMHSLHNSRLPIARLPAEAIACIILQTNPMASLTDTEAYIDTLTSWARLRTVCKAWYHVIDNTPEFSRHIWVYYGGHNISHLRRLHGVGPLRCLITGWETDSLLHDKTLRDNLNLISEIRSELHFNDMVRWRQEWFSSTHGGYPNLSSLTMSARGVSGYRGARSSHPAALESNGASPTLVLEGLTAHGLNPDLFRWVQVLRLGNMVVGSPFVQGICEFIYTTGNITELHLQYISHRDTDFFNLGGIPAGIPNFQGKNSPLRVVSLVKTDSSIATELLNCLSSCRLKVLEVDNLNPWCLDSEGSKYRCSAIAKALGVWSLTGEISPTINSRAMYINFTKLGGQVMTGSDEGWKLESARIGFSATDSTERMHLFKQLSAFGIRVLPSGFVFASVVDMGGFNHAEVLIVDRDRVHDVVRRLVSATQLTLVWAEYSYPLLEQIILLNCNRGALPRSAYPAESAFWTFVTWHQDQASHWHAGSGIAKLKRLGLPSDWIEGIDHKKRRWLESRGIEVSDTDDADFLLSLGP